MEVVAKGNSSPFHPRKQRGCHDLQILDKERMGLLELRPGPLEEGGHLLGLVVPEPKGALDPDSQKPGGGVSEDNSRKGVLSVWNVQPGVSFCDRRELCLLGRHAQGQGADRKECLSSSFTLQQPPPPRPPQPSC